MRRMQEQRASRYRLLREFFRGDAIAEVEGDRNADRLHSILLGEDSRAVGKALSEFAFDGVVVTALVRGGERLLRPSPETRLEAGDAIVLFGPPDDIQSVERRLLG
jgi:CPA2 family monovalent cation:H+ antiporter-2